MLLANKTVVARLLPEQCSNYNAGLESNGGVTTLVSPVNDILNGCVFNQHWTLQIFAMHWLAI